MTGELFTFLGGDPQQSEEKTAADGALMGLVARDRRRPGTPEANRPPMERDFDAAFVFGRTYRGITSRQYSGVIHALMPYWGFTGIMLDPGSGGGGINVSKELGEPEQELVLDLYREPHRNVDLVKESRPATVRPITTREKAISGTGGLPILNLFKRGDEGIDNLWKDDVRNWGGDDCLVHAAMEDLSRGIRMGVISFAPGFTKVPSEHHLGWAQDRVQVLKNLEAFVAQMSKVGVETTTNAEGKQVRLFTGRGTLKYTFPPRKDIFMAGLMAYSAFLVWLAWLQKRRQRLGGGGGESRRIMGASGGFTGAGG